MKKLLKMTNEKLIELLQQVYPNEKIHISRPSINPMTFEPNAFARIGKLGFLHIAGKISKSMSDITDEEELRNIFKAAPLVKMEKPSLMWKLFDPLSTSETDALKNIDPEKGIFGIRVYSNSELEQMGYVAESVPIIEHDGNVLKAVVRGFETLEEFHQFMDGVKNKKVLALFQQTDRTYIARIFMDFVSTENEQ